MIVRSSDELLLQGEEHIVAARHAVRAAAAKLRFGLVDQTKMVTAASELARNAIVHGKGGKMVLEILDDGLRNGLRATFVDTGPGIADIDLALRDGYSSRDSLGLGLGGARRLVNEFEIASTPGEGTTVTIVRWK
jgi:serine/threonine-protein kinase RsbT